VVIERSGQLRGSGYAVDFRSEGHLSVLPQMGLLEQIRPRQTHLRSLRCVDEQGRPTVRVPPAVIAGNVEILRNRRPAASPSSHLRRGRRSASATGSTNSCPTCPSVP
jgi:hypothetical protein